MIRDLVNRAIAGAIAAGAAFVTVVALGATLFYALSLVLTPLGAAAITAGVFALIALVTYLVFSKKAAGQDDDDQDDYDDEPETLTQRALGLIQQRPVVGIVAALAAGAVILKKPGLVALAMTAFNETQGKSASKGRSRQQSSSRRRR